jgi:hypothetical protein
VTVTAVQPTPPAPVGRHPGDDPQSVPGSFTPSQGTDAPVDGKETERWRSFRKR